MAIDVDPEDDRELAVEEKVYGGHLRGRARQQPDKQQADQHQFDVEEADVRHRARDTSMKAP